MRWCFLHAEAVGVEKTAPCSCSKQQQRTQERGLAAECSGASRSERPWGGSGGFHVSRELVSWDEGQRAWLCEPRFSGKWQTGDRLGVHLRYLMPKVLISGSHC